MVTESIIVYRNPAEAVFWESMQDGTGFPIIIAVCATIFVFAVTFASIDSLAKRRKDWKSRNLLEKLSMPAALALSALSFYLVMHFM